MKTNNNDTSTRIELRSEKVRKMIGEIPPALVRWGIAVVAAIFIALLLVLLLVPYPYGNGETLFRHLFRIS